MLRVLIFKAVKIQSCILYSISSRTSLIDKLYYSIYYITLYLQDSPGRNTGEQIFQLLAEM